MAHVPLRLGKVQLEIMRILWREGRATARQITEELARSQSITHSTVQTLLRKLETKGAITHQVEDRTFLFRPLYRQDEVTTTALKDMLSRLFDGSVYGLVSHLLQQEDL